MRTIKPGSLDPKLLEQIKDAIEKLSKEEDAKAEE